VLTLSHDSILQEMESPSNPVRFMSADARILINPETGKIFGANPKSRIGANK